MQQRSDIELHDSESPTEATVSHEIEDRGDPEEYAGNDVDDSEIWLATTHGEVG